MELFLWMESTGIGTWVRESPSLLAYPLVLTLHSIGLAFLVGINVVIDLRILGFATEIPLGPMDRYLPVFWVAFWLNAFSGIALLLASATTLGGNPVFYVKLLCIMLAMATMRLIRKQAFGTGVPQASLTTLAAASLFFWAVAVIAGRLTAYIGVPSLI